MSGSELVNYLLENAKIALVPGDVFGTEGENYVRMSFANSYENIVEGCARLKAAIEKIYPAKASVYTNTSASARLV